MMCRLDPHYKVFDLCHIFIVQIYAGFAHYNVNEITTKC